MSFLPAGAEGYYSDESDEFHFGDDEPPNPTSDDLTSVDYGCKNSVEQRDQRIQWPPPLTTNSSSASPAGETNTRLIRRDQTGSPLIHQDYKTAACNGNLEEIKNFLQRGVKVDSILGGGWTSLMYSLYSGQTDTAVYLLEQGANVNFCQLEGMYCPLLACCTSKAKEDKQLDCLEHLLQHGVDVNIHEASHMTPIMFAAQRGHWKIVSKLLLSNADPNKQDNRGWTALCYAAVRGDMKLIKILVDNGADISQMCSEGTAADVAYCEGFSDVSDYLEQLCNPGHQMNLPVSNTVNGDKDIVSSKESKSSKKHSNTNYPLYNDLKLFLCGLDLSELIPLFQSHKVDFAELLRMNEDDLEKMGIQQFGSRRKIMRSVHEIHKLKWERSSILNPSNNILSQQESLSILDNISQHLSYMSSCMVYIDKNWSAHRTLFDCNKDGAIVGQLSQLTTDAMVQAAKLHNSIRVLKLDVNEACNSQSTVAADLIVDPSAHHNRMGSSTTWLIVSLSGIIILSSIAVYKRFHLDQFLHPSR